MKRIMVIGCCGAGKSTFSRKLHNCIGIPLFHLDQHYWKPNWVESEKEEWTKVVTNLAKQDKWVIDGNYGGTMDIRLNRADTIIYLDYPTWKCFWRVLQRIWKHYGKVRPDMPEGCKERFDLDFLHYVATFNIVKRKSLYAKLNAHKKDTSIHIFKTDQEAAQFLEKFSNQ